MDKIIHIAAGVIAAGMGELAASAYPAVMSYDDSVWVAMFGLATIGVMALYLSSDKIKALKLQFQGMRAVQDDIELRQNIILGVIGERLETSTHGIRRHREVIEAQTQGTYDQEIMESEMVKFRRDEHLLMDALGDLNDFSQVRSGKLILNHVSFDLADLLWELGREVEPHYFLKRNELVYRFDPELIGTVAGDAKRLEQILRTILIEMGQVTYENTVILSLHPSSRGDAITFDLLVPENNEEGMQLQLLDDMFSESPLIKEAHHSSRKLKSYLARELIRLMGGELTTMTDRDLGIHYRIVLPLDVKPATLKRPEGLAAATLIVAHNEPTALSVSDMLSGREPLSADILLEDAAIPDDFSRYKSVIITYTALTEAWIEALEAAQARQALRVIVLKSGFQRTLSLPTTLTDLRVLKLPVLSSDLLAELTYTPRPLKAAS